MAAFDRYLAREILLPFAAALLFLTQILLATQVLTQADVLFGAGASFFDLAVVVIDLVPHFLGYVLPVAFLLGAVLGTARMAQDRELVALSAVGVSITRLVRVPLALGMIFTALALVIGLVLEPAGLRDARMRVNDLVRKNVSTEVRAGVFYEEIPGLTLYVGEIRRGRWYHVLISDRTDRLAPLLALAQSGRLEPAGAGGDLRLVLERGEVHREELQSDEYVTARYGEANLTLALGQALSDRNHLVGSPFELSPRAVVARAHQEPDPAGARRWWTFLHRRIAGPLAVWVFGLLAVPIAAWRRGGRALGYVATLIAVITYYIVLRLGEGLSSRGALPAWLGPQLPNLAVILIGLALIARLERRGAGAVR